MSISSDFEVLGLQPTATNEEVRLAGWMRAMRRSYNDDDDEKR